MRGRGLDRGRCGGGWETDRKRQRMKRKKLSQIYLLVRVTYRQLSVIIMVTTVPPSPVLRPLEVVPGDTCGGRVLSVPDSHAGMCRLS